jgi:hypothetical protein
VISRRPLLFQRLNLIVARRLREIHHLVIILRDRDDIEVNGREPGSLSRSTVTGESREDAGFSFSVPIVTGDRLDEAAFSPSFPVPSSSTDCRLDDFVPLMPESCTRTNCEFGASMEDGGCKGRSNTTLGIKFLKKRQHEDDKGALSPLAHLKRPTVTCVMEYLHPRMRMSQRPHWHE